MTLDQKIRVRYAPSPTGHLHIGNARTALFNYLFARHYGGEFILRIEDTDMQRNIAEGESSQIKYLKWLGIDIDEGIGSNKEGQFGPYRQSERVDIYKKLYEQLLAEDKAYKCYMTAEELEAEREAQRARGEMPRYGGQHAHLTVEQQAAFEAEGRKPSIRFRVPQGQTYRFDDMVKGEVAFESDNIGDFVIVKQDGIPTYNFAVAVDDHLMEITHVLRGDDHISNTPKQQMIYEAFGWNTPRFGHMTLIVNESRKKLSKRDESIIQFIEQYQALGYLPEALFNFIALLGWSPEGEEEIFTKAQFIEIFDEKRLSKSPAFFDNKKLASVNNAYMKKASLETVVALALPHLQQAGKVAQDVSGETLEWVTKVIGQYHQQMSYGAEIVPLSEMFFKDHIDYNEECQQVLAGETVPQVLQVFLDKVNTLPEFTAEALKAAIKEVQQETGCKGKNLFMPIRVATTGETHGPELPVSLELLGRDRVALRLKAVLNK